MTDSLTALQAALAGRYTIERELGRGGNAVVYLAHDVKHDRKVALKVLSPELALTVRTERFFREIQISARLNHPHILTLIDSGQTGESLFYVMPYVEGESLRDRLKRERQLPVDVALAIAKDVSDALGYAHKQGIVHRDIKPENILLHEGHAVVMDFGIARALTVASGEGVTERGIAVGTPAYMSPEQASGGDVDARSDVYSLGCVLYEMLAGHAPFSGTTAQEILGRHALDPVPTVRAVRPNVSPVIEEAIGKALAKHPADRFGTAAQFTKALTTRGGVRSRRRALAYAGLGLVLLVSGSAVASRIFRPPGTPPAEQSIAVLPFVDLSTDRENEYFSDGMTDDLINALTQIPGLSVAAHTSSFALKGQHVDVAEAGRRLKVVHVVEGSVRRVGKQLRVNASLVKTADGFQLWSQQYDRVLEDAGDLFAIQDGISRAIVRALQLELSGGMSQLVVRRGTEDLEAYDLYSRGRYFLSRRSRDDRLKAVDYFTQAIARDSNYALAYTGLADAYSLSASQSAWPVAASYFRQAEAAALKAIRLDDNLSEPHVSLGRVRADVHWDFAGAEREFKRAIQLNPRAAQARSWYGLLLRTMGRCDQAIAETMMAVELEPFEPYPNTLGNALYCARRYDEAVKQYVKAIEMAPDFASPHNGLGITYLAQGRFDAAIAEFEEVRKLNPAGAGGFLGYAYAKAGRRAEALKLQRELELRPSSATRPSSGLAIVAMGLGDYDRALELLENAVETREIRIEAPRYAVWDPVRSHPRFVALVRKMGLEP